MTPAEKIKLLDLVKIKIVNIFHHEESKKLIMGLLLSPSAKLPGFKSKPMMTLAF